MANVILTIPNAFKNVSTKLRDYIPTPQVTTSSKDSDPPTVVFDTSIPENVNNRKFVRRPLSGISVKPGTHAFVQVVDDRGRPIKIFNQIGSLHAPTPSPEDAKANEPLDEYWTDWLLQSVNEQRTEKTQIVETFGVPVFYAFGERPRVLSFQGVLLNTQDFNWRAEFWENWDKFFRATKLVENGWRLFIGFDDILIGGYPLSAVAMQSTQQPNMIRFQFNFFVTNYINTSMIDVGAVQQNRLSIPAEGQTKVARLQEFLPRTSFKDPVYALAKGDFLAKVIGGQNLRFKEFYNNVFQLSALSTGVLGSSLEDVLYNPYLRHIRGSKSATDFLLTYLNKQALQNAYAGVERLAEEVPGGVPGLTFWFGFVGNLYRTLGTNALNLLQQLPGAPQIPGGPAGQGTRWLNMMDRIFTMGSPYGVASYMGYASNAALTLGLKSSTGQLELSNLEYDSRLGLVSKKQDSSFGAKISYRQDPEFGFDAAAQYSSIRPSAEIATQQPLYNSSYGSVSGAVPIVGQFEDDQKPASKDAGQIDQWEAYKKNKSTENERDAVAAQNQDLQVNHGAINIVEAKDEIEDDGVEED